ncbi:MAG: hypothetical protein HN742_42695 [Lentisphaerae bacterium]|nr:hypothetical protein [Lentisphaerota bacterium]MBT4816819.1 hypothetical protein [Lentisphaerota bacterium]MBT5609490.1 hypothetical protein [Lentisphaerota bacterium]MBT7057699.1 hypothetical protein [Lentisphaerota bacterium]MBT7848648.1 hypothetical protein [Lentisphaerota bacterium]
MLKRYIEDLESRIDASVEGQLVADWQAFVSGDFKGDIFSPSRVARSSPSLDWPQVRVNEALEDHERMALQQLAGCSGILSGGSGNLLAVRCNYGSSILPSLFGVELFIMDDATNTLPTTCPIADGEDGIRRLIDAGVPEFNAGFGGRALEMGRRFVELFADYPGLHEHVTIYHPDLQGPMDVCEVVWGSSLFLALFDNPELVKSLLDLVTQTYIAFMREWQTIVPHTGDTAVHWSMMHPGCVMLRDDSAMNLSPDMFDEFILPYNQRILEAFGGGADHFCGRGDHYIDRLTSIPGVRAINLSQPDWNDMDKIFDATVERDVLVIGLDRGAAETALAGGRDLRGLVHCR